MDHISTDADAAACRRLWISVLTTAARDLLTPDGNGLNAHQTQLWLGSKAFRMVCELAGVCPRRFRQRIEELSRRRDALFAQVGETQHRAKNGRRTYLLEQLLNEVGNA